MQSLAQLTHPAISGVVCVPKIGQCRQSWAWDPGKRVQVEPMKAMPDQKRSTGIQTAEYESAGGALEK